MRGLRLLALAGLAVCLSVAWAGQSFAERAKPLEKAEIERLNQISDYFNGITTLAGTFIQQDSFGSAAQGRFYFRRPNRMRFEYVEPPNLAILSDGTWYMVNDLKERTVQRYPLASTPVHIFLRQNVDLVADERITDVIESPGEVTVVAKDQSGLVQGELRMTFATPAIELRKWTVVDPQGIETTVALSNMIAGGHLRPELFIPDEADNKL